MRVDISEGCPRCGGEVHDISSVFQCVAGSCRAYWTNGKSYTDECIARDLAGTRKRFDPNGEFKIAGLEDQLSALIKLVRLNTLKEVEEATTLAIRGRKPVDNQAEIAALESMRNWIRRQM